MPWFTWSSVIMGDRETSVAFHSYALNLNKCLHTLTYVSYGVFGYKSLTVELERVVLTRDELEQCRH